MIAQTRKQKAEQCYFTIIVDSQKIPFAITHFLETLEPTKYRSKIPELEKKIDNNIFHTQAGNPNEPSLADTVSNTRRKAEDKANLVKFKVIQLGRVDIII